MPAFFSLLLPSYYSNNFAGKIDTSLLMILDLRDDPTGSAYYTNAKATYSGCHICVAKLLTLSLSE